MMLATSFDLHLRLERRGAPDEVQRPPAELACMQHVFPDSGNYQVDISVRDPQGRGDRRCLASWM